MGVRRGAGFHAPFKLQLNGRGPSNLGHIYYFFALGPINITTFKS